MSKVGDALDEIVERLRSAEVQVAYQDALIQHFAEHGKPPTAKQLDDAVAQREPASDEVLLARAVRKLTTGAEFEAVQLAVAEEAMTRASNDKIDKARERLADAERAAEQARTDLDAVRDRAALARELADGAEAEALERTGGRPLPDIGTGRNVAVTPQSAGGRA